MVGVNLAASPCVMSADASGILDTRNTIRTPIFDGSDTNWERRRAKFETYAGLAKRTLLQNNHLLSDTMVG